jgi:hypothetical protein
MISHRQLRADERVRNNERLTKFMDPVRVMRIKLKNGSKDII